MQCNDIPDSSISASSHAGKHFQPYFGRLNSLSYSGWCTSELDDAQYLLIDLSKVSCSLYSLFTAIFGSITVV